MKREPRECSAEWVPAALAGSVEALCVDFITHRKHFSKCWHAVPPLCQIMH